MPDDFAAMMFARPRRARIYVLFPSASEALVILRENGKDVATGRYSYVGTRFPQIYRAFVDHDRRGECERERERERERESDGACS